MVANGSNSVADWNPRIDADASSRTCIAEATSFPRLLFGILQFPLEDASASWFKKKPTNMKSALRRFGILWRLNCETLKLEMLVKCHCCVESSRERRRHV